MLMKRKLVKNVNEHPWIDLMVSSRPSFSFNFLQFNVFFYIRCLFFLCIVFDQIVVNSIIDFN